MYYTKLCRFPFKYEMIFEQKGLTRRQPNGWRQDSP
jgi:hypothetical protein